MRTRRFIKRCFAFAVSVVMVWVITVIPSRNVMAQFLFKSFATPSITEVGSYVYWQGTGLQPNRVYWVRMSKDGQPVGGDICPDDTITTDATGNWSKVVGPMTPADVGAWSIGIVASSYCGEGNTDVFDYRVTAVPFRLSVNNPTLEPGAAATFAISGAPPNQPIRWSTYKDGQLIEKDQSYGEYTDANGNFSKSSSTAQLNWGAQAPALGHLIGRADADGWSASVGLDGEGWLQYGPYTTQVPAGNHTAVWNLMIDNNDADNGNVVYLDVYDYTANTVLATREVKRKEWGATWQYQPFLLPFTTAEAGHYLEFRIYWRGIAYVREQQVSVDPAWTRYQPGTYMKVANVYNTGLGGQYNATTGFKVLDRPKFTFTLSPGNVPVGGYLNHQITGAPPNTPVYWTRFWNGRPWDTDAFLGNTDANGNWAWLNHGPWQEVYSGLWTERITIGDISVEKHFVVGNIPSTAIPPNAVYSYTPATYDPGTGKYYSDMQAHVGGPDLSTDPIADMSTRTWFNDAGAIQFAGLDIGNISVLHGAITSGRSCNAYQTVPPECKKCSDKRMSKCLSDFNWEGAKSIAGSYVMIVGCITAAALTIIGIPLSLVCIVHEFGQS